MRQIHHKVNCGTTSNSVLSCKKCNKVCSVISANKPTSWSSRGHRGLQTSFARVLSLSVSSVRCWCLKTAEMQVKPGGPIWGVVGLCRCHSRYISMEVCIKLMCHSEAWIRPYRMNHSVCSSSGSFSHHSVWTCVRGLSDFWRCK